MAKNMVLDDIRRALTYFLIEEAPSNVDVAVIRDKIERFLQEEAVKYETKELVKWLDPPEKALGIFLEHLKSKGVTGALKILWH